MMANKGIPKRGRERFLALVRAGLRILIGAVFIYAAWEKILDPTAFSEAVSNYRLIPESLLHAVALVLPPLELICGALFIFGRWPAVTAWLVLLGIAFILAQAQALARGLDIECGCFGAEANSPLTVSKLLSNVLLLAVLLFFWQSDRRSSARAGVTHVS
jgi:uncharacterized membrane protein YphA (DoxX/SURF4 family)